MRTFSEIVKLIKSNQILDKDAEVAKLLRMHPNKLGSYKSRNIIPWESLTNYCKMTGSSLDYLLDLDVPQDKRLELVSEEATIYDNINPQLNKIIDILINDLPEMRPLVLKLLRTRLETEKVMKTITQANIDDTVESLENIKKLGKAISAANKKKS